MRRGKPLGSLALVLALAASACGSTSDTSATASDDVTSSTAANSDGVASSDGATNSDGVAGLAGEFGTLDGASVDLASLNGEDVVLWFWAPW